MHGEVLKFVVGLVSWSLMTFATRLPAMARVGIDLRKPAGAEVPATTAMGVGRRCRAAAR